MLFSLLSHYLDTDTALKVSQSLYCYTTSVSYGVENYFPRLWGAGISDAIFELSLTQSKCITVLNLITIYQLLLFIYTRFS